MAGSSRWKDWLHGARKHAAWLLAAVLVLAVAALAAPRMLRGPKVAVLQVVQRDFVQTVVASGRVETPHRADVGVQVTGTVVAVPVAQGQTVPAGALLIELESTEARAAVSQAELAVKQAAARVRQVREVDAPNAEQAVRQAQANHEVAERTLKRNRELIAREFIGQAALDDSERAASVAQSILRTAQQQLASARPGGSNAVSADAALAQARAAAEAARARLRYTRVLAPAAGTLIARNVERGDVVQPGKPLMVLSPSGAAQLVVQIDEKNLKLLAVGQDALASADAYADQRFAAKLAYINPGIDAQRGSVEVKLDVPQPPDYLRQDMTVSVDIEVARRPAAVLVPTEAVRGIDSPAPWLLKVEDGHARRQPVKLGLRSRGWCEVLSGASAGDAVLPATGPAALQVAEGARVRAIVPQR
ncbi:efflux RND transporter periplasmic adaptor subunit [Ramlibacter sp. USB13]|uniref:Efflux RND transporter periplasmic adaptor subunit n=1 Tax=Ramlibacter cellulosilyticus TaxID=2764187 RepID=A0A923MN94_9BURK|nr:efflux RND transporter periplasmic adaptor subunit [Ramlibacter cellulosilyticus]MBC5781801.1 efflux RND transporter periplasmic adaptor subunit [Ramlibacter cellulosilyticus]